MYIAGAIVIIKLLREKNIIHLKTETQPAQLLPVELIL